MTSNSGIYSQIAMLFSTEFKLVCELGAKYYRPPFSPMADPFSKTIVALTSSFFQ